MAFIGSVLAGTITATGTALISAFASSFLGQFLISTVLGAALRALSPKPSTGGNRGYQTNQQGPAQDHSVIYGETKVGGVIIYDEATGVDSKFLHRVIAVAGHEIDSFVNFYINDELAIIDSSGNVTSPTQYDGKIRINTHTGSPSQEADSDLVAESGPKGWNFECKLSGIAYFYVRLTFDANAFPNGIPTFTTTVKGKKVFDPRTGAVAFSANPALCLRDYITSGKGSNDTTPYSYGLGEDVANVDDALVTSSANICDQTNTAAGTVRYDMNGSFTTAATPYDTITAMLTAMGGSLWYAQGSWRMKSAYYTTPVMDLNEDDLRSGISVGTRHSRRDNFNTIKGTFRGLESDWQVTDYPEVTNSAFVDADGGQVSVADVDLPFTDTSITARRLALISLERNRQQLTVTASFGLRTLGVQVGDNVRITNTRFGWTNKEFEVIQWSFGLVEGLDLQVDMTLRETASSVFDEVSDGREYEKDNTQLPSLFDVPPIGMDFTTSLQVSNEQVSNVATVLVSSGRTEGIDYVEVDYKVSSEEEYSSFGQGRIGEFKVRDLEVNFYDFRARAVNTFGVKGQYVFLLNREVNPNTGNPSNVASLTAELSGGTLFLSWPPVIDADLSHYQVKHNSSTFGATWNNSTSVIDKIARPATSIAVPARAGTFLIKAYDKEGNLSEDVTTTIILSSELPPLGNLDSVSESNQWFGAKDNVIISSPSGYLEIDLTDKFEGTYTFFTVLDTGSSRTARVTGIRTFTRSYNNGTLLWDDIPQNWDTWPDNWDTWTDEDAGFGDVSVAIYVSATYDDPFGTPTWGSYFPANGSDVVGRGFRFKAILSNTNENFTPSVSALSATVEY